MSQKEEAQVLVVGAGLSGLTAATELQRRGIDVLVLEAAPRVGGRTYSVATELGSHLDLGGQWIGYGHHRITTLAEKAKGTIYKTYSHGLPQIVHNGKTVSPLSPYILLGAAYVLLFDLLSKLYVPQSWDTVTVEAFISRWATSELAHQLLCLLAAITSTAELGAYSIGALAKSLPISGGCLTLLSDHGGAQDSLMAESMGAIVSMMAKNLGTKVLTNAVVTSVKHSGTGVEVRTTDGQHFSAEEIIITIPPPMLKDVSFEPTLPASRQALQNNTRMGVVYKAMAVFGRPFWRDRKCGQFMMLDDPPHSVFDSSFSSGPGHLCFLVPGTPARRLDWLDEEQRREKLLGQLIPFMGREILEPLEWHEKSWQQDQFCGGGYLAFPVVGTAEGLLPMPHQSIGSIHWAGTETAQEHPGYLEGAVQSGERAASEVALKLSRTF